MRSRPVADAYYDNIPLVVITGQVGTGDMRGDLPIKQRGFQEVDTVALMKPITKAAFLVKDIARSARCAWKQAFFLAREGRQGPVVVDLPMNVQRGACADPAPIAKRTERAAVCARRQDRDPGAMDQRSRAAGDPGRRRRDRLRRAARNCARWPTSTAFPSP